MAERQAAQEADAVVWTDGTIGRAASAVVRHENSVVVSGPGSIEHGRREAMDLSVGMVGSSVCPSVGGSKQ